MTIGLSLLRALHVLSLLLLAALTGVAFASSTTEYRKKLLMWAGMASLVVFLTGFALLGMMKYGVPTWAIVKLICWLVLSALAGLAFRMREQVRSLAWIGVAVSLTALVMVFFRPI